MTTPRPGLRERKKEATRKALREAALRLAMDHGPDNVRVDDIADAAGVSPRTYNNYFPSREQAIVAAVTAEREARVAAQVAARPADVRLSAAVTDAIVEQYTGQASHDPRVLPLITASPALRDAFLATAAGIEHPLAAVIADRAGTSQLTARVLAASAAAAVRVALAQWTQPVTGASGLIAVSGSLPELLRAALAPLTPALDSAGEQPHRAHRRLPLAVFGPARLVFRLIDARLDHRSCIARQQSLWDLAEGVADRTGLRDEGEGPDHVVPVARPFPRDDGSAAVLPGCPRMAPPARSAFASRPAPGRSPDGTGRPGRRSAAIRAAGANARYGRPHSQRRTAAASAASPRA